MNEQLLAAMTVPAKPMKEIVADVQDSVAEVEFLEDAGDVRLRRRFADDELFADLRVRHPPGEQREDFLLARC